MDILKQLKEVALSVLPICIIASILSFVTGVTDVGGVMQFLFSGVLVIIGLTLFLTGVNIGLIPIGNKIGSAVTRSKSIWIIILVSFLLGFIITVAEPDVQVLAGQVAGVNPAIPAKNLTYAIGIGVGIFMTISLLRTILNLPLKVVLFISYILVFGLAAFIDEFFVSVAFDSGGATTGPLSVPFIMALGMGVAATRAKTEDSEFGYVALSSVGPISAVLVMGLVYGSSSAAGAEEAAEALGLGAIMLSKVEEVGLSLLPLVVVCMIAQIFFIKLPFHQMKKILLGILYSYIGLIFFMSGVDFSFSDVAQGLGAELVQFSPVLLVLVGGVFGACVVLAEPAIWVLTEQVEDVSAGHIKRGTMLMTLSIGVAMAVVLGMIRTLFSLSIWCFILPGYLIILLAMIKCPKLFSAIAFDSGGVATGPMSSAFILPYAIGAASVGAASSSAASFGMIGLIAMMPVLCVEVLGLIYGAKTRKKGGAE